MDRRWVGLEGQILGVPSTRFNAGGFLMRCQSCLRVCRCEELSHRCAGMRRVGQRGDSRLRAAVCAQVSACEGTAG